MSQAGKKENAAMVIMNFSNEVLASVYVLKTAQLCVCVLKGQSSRSSKVGMSLTLLVQTCFYSLLFFVTLEQ